MKIERTQLYRLIIPLTGLISGFILELEIMKGFAIGYFYCWVFNQLYSKELRDSETKRGKK